LKDRGFLKHQLLDTSNNCRNVLHSALENKNSEILNYLIETLLKHELSEFECSDLITGHDKDGSNILHLAMRTSLVSLERMVNIFKMIEQEVDPTTYQQMLMRRLESRENLLHLAAKRGEIDIFRWIHAHVESKISRDVAKEMLQSQCNVRNNIIVSLKKTLEVSKVFLPYFEELLSADVVEEFLLGDPNILHMTCKVAKFDNFVFLFNHLKRKFGLEEVHALLLYRDNHAANILDSAALNHHYGFFADLFAFIKREVGDTKVRELLRYRITTGWNIFHRALINQNLLIFEDIADVVEYELPEDYTKLLTSTTFGDDNLIAVCLFSNAQDFRIRKTFFKFLLKFLDFELGSEVVKNMLLNIDETGSNILLVMANQKDFQGFKLLLEHLETVFDAATIKKLLLDDDDFGYSVLQSIRPRSDFVQFHNLISKRVDVKHQFQDTQIALQVFPFPGALLVLDKELGEIEVNQKLMQSPDILLLVCDLLKKGTSSYTIMIDTIDMVVQRLGVEVLKQMAVQKGGSKVNPSMHICQGYLDRFAVTEIFDCLHKYVGPDFFKEVLTATDSDSGENIFFILVATNVPTMQHIVEYLNDKLGPQVVKDMMKAENESKQETPISRAAKNYDNNVFAYLLTLFSDEISPPQLKFLILSRVNIAVISNNYRLIKHWFEVAKKLPDEMVVNKANLIKYKFVNRIASNCDSIVVSQFLALIELDIGDLVDNWLEVLQAAVRNPSTLTLTMLVEACRKKMWRRDFLTTLATVEG
jgi:hypothetical protein